MQPLAFCPAHSGEKSPLPWLSAFARSGATAAAASGKAGAGALIGPSSRMRRFTMPRAGRPVKTLVTAVCARGLALQRGAVHRAGRGLGAEQVGGADLHAGRAERHRRRDAARVGDAARGDHRHLHRVARSAAPARACRPACDRSSDRNMPRWPPASMPCAMIASTPRASSQRASSTVVADDRIFAPQPRTRASSVSRAAGRNGSSRPAARTRRARRRAPR